MVNVYQLVSFSLLVIFCPGFGFQQYNQERMQKLREEVKEMFYHAYDGYMKYAYPYDELRPLSCDGMDTWGSYSLTLVDALDTLVVLNNHTEFRRIVQLLLNHTIDFNKNINVSVFETNIRIVGGLLSAHLMSRRAGMELEPGWPCNGPLLRLAENVARRLLAAFDTPTGMPYGTINLREGIPSGETPITCTAGVGTFLVEFGTLSRLTGNPVYEETALRAVYALWRRKSTIGLFGNHIDVLTGRWTAVDAGIGAGVDSFFEYLVKGSMLLNRPELLGMFKEAKVAIDKHLRKDDWHVWATMAKGQVTMPIFQSLEAYWPGVLSLTGELESAMKTLHNYHQVWRQYGFTPESYNIPQGELAGQRSGYPLRPELVESCVYLYRATKDPFLLQVGEDILRAIQHSAKTRCGYATIKDVKEHKLEDRMESFFLSETSKYLYLLFDPDNFLLSTGQSGVVFNTGNDYCILETGPYVFNTEAHPVDPGALHCCSNERYSDATKHLASQAANLLDPEGFSEFRGFPHIPGRRNKVHNFPEEVPSQSETEPEEVEVEAEEVSADEDSEYFNYGLGEDQSEAIEVIDYKEKEKLEDIENKLSSKIKIPTIFQKARALTAKYTDDDSAPTILSSYVTQVELEEEQSAHTLVKTFTGAPFDSEDFGIRVHKTLRDFKNITAKYEFNASSEEVLGGRGGKDAVRSLMAYRKPGFDQPRIPGSLNGNISYVLHVLDQTSLDSYPGFALHYITPGSLK